MEYNRVVGGESSRHNIRLHMAVPTSSSMSRKVILDALEHFWGDQVEPLLMQLRRGRVVPRTRSYDQINVTARGPHGMTLQLWVPPGTSPLRLEDFGKLFADIRGKALALSK